MRAMHIIHHKMHRNCSELAGRIERVCSDAPVVRVTKHPICCRANLPQEGKDMCTPSCEFLCFSPYRGQVWAVEPVRALSDVRGVWRGTPAREGPFRSVTAEPSLLRGDRGIARIHSPH